MVVAGADFEFSVGPLLLVNSKVDPHGGIWVSKRSDGWYEVKVPGDFGKNRFTGKTQTAVADYAWGYLREAPSASGPKSNRRNPSYPGRSDARTLMTMHNQRRGEGKWVPLLRDDALRIANAERTRRSATRTRKRQRGGQ